MRVILCFIVYIILPTTAFPQAFTIKCNYKNKRIPDLYFIPQDNILPKFYINNIPLIKDSDTTAYLKLKPSVISFFKIGFDAVLVSPGEHVEGTFNGSDFQPTDTNTINFTLKRISKGITAIVINYPMGGDFNMFKSVAKLLIRYRDSTNQVLMQNPNSRHNPGVTAALKEYITTRLAHFLVLPILFKNDYNKNELNEIIKKNITILFPEYWLQIESGRIFMQTYYRKIALPDADYNLQKSVENKFYSFHSIRKLAYYNYFLECMEKGIIKTKSQLLHDYEQAISKVVLSSKEQEEMKDVRKQIQKICTDISDVFSTLPLINQEGKMLSLKEKKALVGSDNIILDFWASWCIPCRQKMTKLNTDKIMFNHKQYKIIYLSIDENQNSWKKAYFPFLNKNNSFRITDGNNQFVNDFAISRIPRYILISQSGLISSEFAFE